MANTPKLTIKEVKLIKALVSGKTMGEAGMLATGSTTPESGAVQAGRMLKRVGVQEKLEEAFKTHGITVDAATKPIADGLKADKVHIVGNGEQAMAEVVPDHSIRLKASSMAFNLMGVGRNQEPQGNTYNFVQVSAGDREAFDL